jgi:DNA-binding XRE family transcriptional regulator
MSSDRTSSFPPQPAQAQAGEESDARRRLRNNVRRLREDRLLTKAELARKAGVSTLTIDRVEAGMPCRMDTKRKIILGLGMTVAEKDKVFVQGEDDDGEGQGPDPGGDTKE